MTFTGEEGSPSVLFQNSLGPMDAEDGSGENYPENLNRLMTGKEAPELWMTCIDCADSREEFAPYLQRIQPKNILAVHFDGLSPDIGSGLQESFQEPEWYPQSLEEFGAEGLYPNAYFQSYVIRKDVIEK